MYSSKLLKIIAFTCFFLGLVGLFLSFVLQPHLSILANSLGLLMGANVIGYLCVPTERRRLVRFLTLTGSILLILVCLLKLQIFWRCMIFMNCFSLYGFPRGSSSLFEDDDFHKLRKKEIWLRSSVCTMNQYGIVSMEKEEIKDEIS